MKNKISNLNRDFYKRKLYTKNEIKMLTLKSIIHNLNVKPTVRALARKRLSKMDSRSFISKQNNNICLLSGRFKGSLRLTNLSRHFMKKLGLINNLQNIKIKAW